MEEFEKLGDPQADLFTQPTAEPPTDAADASAEAEEAPSDTEAGAKAAVAEPATSGVDDADATPATEEKA